METGLDNEVHSSYRVMAAVVLEQAQTAEAVANTSFAEGDFFSALEFYSKAITMCPPQESAVLAVFYANRAACLIKLERLDEALSDCGMAIHCDPTYVKALCRRAHVLETMQRYRESLVDLATALKLRPPPEACESIRRTLARLKSRDRAADSANALAEPAHADGSGGLGEDVGTEQPNRPATRGRDVVPAPPHKRPGTGWRCVKMASVHTPQPRHGPLPVPLCHPHPPSHPIPHSIPSHPIPSHPIPSHPIPSHPIPSHPCLRGGAPHASKSHWQSCGPPTRRPTDAPAHMRGRACAHPPARCSRCVVLAACPPLRLHVAAARHSRTHRVAASCTAVLH